MLTLLLIGMLTLAFNIQPVKAEPKTWTVDDDGPADFSKIQDAINAANPGDTVIVSEGIYAEGQINVNKSLTTLTSGTVTVDGLTEGHVFYITANNVTINGFTVKNSKLEWPYSGIYLYYVQNSNVTGNTIINNYGGIGLDRSYGNHITGNKVANSKWIGIRLVDDSDRNYITENNITNNMIGMVLCWSSRNTLSDNHLISNKHNLGVVGRALSHFVHDIDTSNTVNGKQVYYLLNKSGFVIEPSTFPDAGYLALVNSTNIVARNLTLANNGAGVLLAYTTNSTIEEIKAINNSIGISLISSDGNNIVKNNLTSNDVGIYLFSSSTNMIYHNNFINNTGQVYSEASINVWDDGYPSGGNYWSDYADVDLYSGPYQNETGSDGIWDHPYVIDENNQDRYPLMNPCGAPTPPVVINATVDIHPQALNLISRGKWFTAYIELPEGYNVADINVSSMMLNDTIPAELRPLAIGDYDEDGIPDLMVKFDRAEVISYIIANVNMTKLFEERFMTITLTITGYLYDDTLFQGSDTIRIMKPPPRRGGVRDACSNNPHFFLNPPSDVLLIISYFLTLKHRIYYPQI